MNNKNGFNSDTKTINIPLKIKNYKFEKELFQISNAYLCLATNINIKEKVLIKIYDKENFHHNSDEISLINNEIFIMRIINHKNCLKLYEIIETPSYIYLIMENFSGFLLSETMDRKKRLTEDESLNIYKQIISALIYFHEMKIGHLNINPDNILIDTNNNIKFVDFKYSTIYSNNEKIKLEQLGDQNYLSPEIWSEKTCFPEMADIWSSGVLLYYLLIGQLPFKGINNFDLQKKIMGAEFPLPLNISKNFQDFFKNIFEPKIDARFNLEKIVNSALFKEKKINKNTLPKGFNIFTTKYPIDERVIDICKTYFEIDPENLKQKLGKNIFDPQTSLYKQIISSFIRKKISSEIDLTSKEFNTYISNPNNFYDESTKNSVINDNINKYQETKKLYPEQKTKITKNQNDILNKLNALIKKCNIPQEGKPKDLEPENPKEEKVETKKINQENISKNKNDMNNSTNNLKKQNKNANKNINNKKRGSIYFISLNSKLKKSNAYENKLNLNVNPGNRRRMSSAINTNYKFNFTLDKDLLKEVDKLESTKNKSKKYISNKDDVIKETNEEEKKQLSESSSKSSRSSSCSKTKETKKETKKNVISPKDINKKDLKVNSVQSKPERAQKEKKKTIITKTPQINSKQDFFNQIRGVKLKKYTPNTYANPDEIKKKPKEENKNASPIDYNNNSSVKEARQNIEEKNSKKNIHNNPTHQGKNPKNKNLSNTASKASDLKENKIQSQKAITLKKNPMQKKPKEYLNSHRKKRKSYNYVDILLFQTKGIIIGKDEIEKRKSKDDTSSLKFGSPKKKVKSEEDLVEIKIKKSNKKNDEEQRKTDEEKIKKEKEEEERKMKEELEKKRKEDEEKKLKELEELRLKQEEEEKIRKELEEQERLRKEKEEEEKRKQLEEMERQRKEKKEEEKRKEEERLRLEEEERINKLKEEERLKKEAQERAKKEEEERIRKKKEEIERKKREIQEENRRRLEEYERKRKEDEEKKILKEKLRKKKEEELRQKKEIELKAFREKKNIKNKKIESDTESISEDKNHYNHIKRSKLENDKLRAHKKKKPEGTKLFDFNNFRKPETQISENESIDEEEIIENKKNMNNSQIERNDSSKNNIFDKYTDFFFSENKMNDNRDKMVNKTTKFKEKNESQIRQSIFYHYQNPQEADKKKYFNRSSETLNNHPKDKITYQHPQSSFNNLVNEDYLNQKRSNPKSFKKLKIKTTKKNKRNINLYTNNIHSIKIKNINTKNINTSQEKEPMSDRNYNNQIKANNVFKKKGIGKIYLRNKDGIRKKALSQEYISDYEQQLLRYSSIFENNPLSTSKKENNKTNKNRSLKKNQIINYKNNNLNNNSSSNSSISSINNKKNSNYNMSYQSNSKIAKKIRNFINVSRNDINHSNKTNKTIIKIRRHSQQKRKNIKENELPIYKGDIDYNEVSLKNIKETIDYLIKKFKKDGYACIKKGLAKFKFYKDTDICLVEIMRLGNGLLYYNVTKP